MSEETDHDILMEIRGALLGINGQGGLLRSHDALKRDYYNFKRWVIGIFCFLVGSGIIGIGAVQIANFIGG